MKKITQALYSVLSSYTPNPLHLVGSPEALTPLSSGAAELCIFFEGADKQNHSANTLQSHKT